MGTSSSVQHRVNDIDEQKRRMDRTNAALEIARRKVELAGQKTYHRCATVSSNGIRMTIGSSTETAFLLRVETRRSNDHLFAHARLWAVYQRLAPNVTAGDAVWAEFMGFQRNQNFTGEGRPYWDPEFKPKEWMKCQPDAKYLVVPDSLAAATRIGVYDGDEHAYLSSGYASAPTSAPTDTSAPVEEGGQ